MRKRAKIAEAEFQMAPMIDMVFLLLVFFMTVSTLAKEARPELDLPYSKTATVPVETPPRQILTLRPAGEAPELYHFNRRENLESLSVVMAAHNGEEWLLRAPPELPWKAFHRVLEELRARGVSRATLATYEE